MSPATHSKHERYIEDAKNALQQLNSPYVQKESNVGALQQCIDYINRSRILENPVRVEEQVWLIDSVQNFGTVDTGVELVSGVFEWCERSWNRVREHDPNNPTALQGLGRVWISRADEFLYDIRRDGRKDVGEHSFVQARTALVPARDFFAAAARSAASRGNPVGKLWEQHAQALIDLGEVSESKHRLQCFDEAIGSIRKAAASPGHVLSSYLAQWFDRYERYGRPY